MNKKLFSLFLSITILFTLTAPVFAAENTFKNVDFQYSITPEMDEWKNLQSLDEMIEACQIPTTLLNHPSNHQRSAPNSFPNRNHHFKPPFYRKAN